MTVILRGDVSSSDYKVKKLAQQVKDRDREIAALKQLLADMEAKIERMAAKVKYLAGREQKK